MNTTPLPAFAFVRTGSYSMFDISAQYAVVRNFDVVFGLKNVGDQHVELAWGFPQPGRAFYLKMRMGL